MWNRDGDMVRVMTYRRWNSDTESIENGISNMMELGGNGPGVRPEIWN